MQAQDLGAHLHAQAGIQGGERLVHQQHLRLLDDRPADGHALLLAAGELAGLHGELVGQAEGGGHLIHLLVHAGAGEAGDAQRVADVLAHRHVGEQRDVLEDHGDVALLRGQRGDVGVAEPDAAGGGGLEAGDHPQSGRLAAAGGADEGEELALADLERQVAHRVYGASAAAEALVEAFQPDRERHAASPSPRSAGRSAGSAAGRTRAGRWAPRPAPRRPSPCPSARRSAPRRWRGRRAA